ncbi:2-isopropylmalate synthase, partial [Francisella tularensis subsp. holarctica]|nr:2-isopropylmalate synthase [Francisella tularensis subsp. holarctica]
CVMFINLFGKQKDYHYYNDVNFAHFKTISDFIGKRMLSRQPNHPITGLNSARHTSGGHTNARLKNPIAYQTFHPESV